MCAPVRAGRSLFGMLGVDECSGPRRWSPSEVDALRLSAGLLGSAIERRRTEERLRLSDGRYRELAERAVEGLSFSDEEGIIRYANTAFCRVLGYRPSEVIGRRVESLLDERGLVTYAQEARRRRRGEASCHELGLRAKSGEMVPLKVSAVPVYDAEGRYHGGYGIFTDVSERVRLERMRDDILREISHELKAPAAKIRMGLDLVKKHVAYSDREGALGFAMIETEVARIQRNVDLLADLSAFESGSVAPGRERIDVREMLCSLVSRMRPAARRRGLALCFSCGPGCGSLRGDSEKLRKLFLNVIGNAIAFSRSGSITVSARRVKGGVVVRVKDEGRGIEPPYLEKIFKKGYKRYSSEPGLGIGLTLCRMIAEMHGGSIRAESKGRGKGMTVAIYLPGYARRKNA